MVAGKRGLNAKIRVCRAFRRHDSPPRENTEKPVAHPDHPAYIPRSVSPERANPIELLGFRQNPRAKKMKARLYDKYVNEVVPALKEKRGYKNVHQIPKLEKIVVNMGVPASAEKGALEEAVKDLSLITGRKPAISKSRHSIANFKLREGQAIGCRVTLRREAMYEFLDRLVAATLPRIRDFRGISPRSFDGRGNYSLGMADQTVFPEIELEKVKRNQGMDITFVTSAPTNEEAFDLLKGLGMPFAEK
jgi:large subunit ribosomal protein L5